MSYIMTQTSKHLTSTTNSHTIKKIIDVHQDYSYAYCVSTMLRLFHTSCEVDEFISYPVSVFEIVIKISTFTHHQCEFLISRNDEYQP